MDDIYYIETFNMQSKVTFINLIRISNLKTTIITKIVMKKNFHAILNYKVMKELKF